MRGIQSLSIFISSLLVMSILARRVEAPGAVIMGEPMHESASENTSRVTLRAVGDIMLAGPMEHLMDRKGSDYPFAVMAPVLKKADIAFANLECCIATVGHPIPKRYNFRASPRHVSALHNSGFTVVSCANNHAWDFGREALQQTVDTVEKTGVVVVGAGANREAAHQLRIIKRKGLKVGFLAYLGLLPALIKESDTETTLSMASMEAIRAEVTAARPQVDVLIVSLHAGKEGAPTATVIQRTFAQSAIDAGADLVIGHHPHVVQPLVRYHNRFICYSLGNFVFSSTGRGTGGMLEAVLTKHGCETARLIPLELNGAQPQLP